MRWTSRATCGRSWRRTVFRCHGPKKQEGGLRLDVRRRALVGGDTGAGVRPGTAKGEVLRRVTSATTTRSDAAGRRAADGRSRSPHSGPGSSRGRSGPTSSPGRSRPRNTGRSARSSGRRSRPCRTPKSRGTRSIAFVLAQLEAKGLQLSPEADRRTLIRRLHLDLIGLPPTPEEVEAFVNDTSPDAYEQLVDRLLASPHFGERWGRHWLDLARFAESDGYENDRLRPDAWRFRDWVDRRLQPRPAVRPVHRSSSSPATCCPNATAEQKIAAGLSPQHALEQRRRRATRRSSAPTPSRTAPTRPAAVWLGLTLGCASATRTSTTRSRSASTTSSTPSSTTPTTPTSTLPGRQAAPDARRR